MSKKRNEETMSRLLWGLIIILGGVIALLHPLMGPLGRIAFALFNIGFGYCAYVFIVVVILSGILYMTGIKITNKRIILGFMLLCIVAMTLCAYGEYRNSQAGTILKDFFGRVELIFDELDISMGGFIGNTLYVALKTALSNIGTIIICSLTALVGFILMVLGFGVKIRVRKKSSSSLKNSSIKTEIRPAAPLPLHAKKEEMKEKTEDIRPDIKETKPVEPLISNSFAQDTTYKYPPVDAILDNYMLVKKNVNQKNAVEKWAILSQSLESFGLPSTCDEYHIGPSVTQFEIVPKENFLIKKYQSVIENLKMDLAVKDLRIQAPIPGKKAVGIEIPNVERIPVRLKELIASMPKEYENNPLVMCLGKDLSGKGVYDSIFRMPHLLIAGQTGSGKSVCENALILTILMRARPDEVKLLLIDPKKVEFSPYAMVPHLIAPIITDTSKAASALGKLVAIMESRYDLFSKAGVKKIDEYNRNAEKKMYRIVCVIDEMADLMATHGKDVEGYISRLASLARAAGIYIIMATQRPSTDVITGVIKANIASRIAFAVASTYDSRTILDQIGAEGLFGNGDMLFNPTGASAPIRVQGVYVSDEEIERTVKYFADSNMVPKYEDIFLIDENESGEDGGYNENLLADDPYYNRTVKPWVITQKAISASALQRRFSLGFPRAAKMIDALELEGIIGPNNGSKPREVLVQNDKTDKAEQ